MYPSTKLDDKLEGIENFCAWKYKIWLIVEENDLANFIKEVVLEPEKDEAKEKYKKDVIRAKRMIVYSLNDVREIIYLSTMVIYLGDNHFPCAYVVWSNLGYTNQYW